MSPPSNLKRLDEETNKVNYTSVEVDEDNLAKFLSWCTSKGTSKETCQGYVRQLRSGFRPESKWNRLAWKSYYKFIGRMDLWEELKTRRSGVDLYVPNDEEMINTIVSACETSLALCWTYKLLVYSGSRLVEITKLLGEHREDKWIEKDGYYKYPLSWIRGMKSVFYIYTVEKPPRVKISSHWVSNWASKIKPDSVRPKYVRKWVATKMMELGIPEEVVNFIQGRHPRSVLAQHYLKLSLLADNYYEKYARWIKGWIKSKINSESLSYYWLLI